MIDVEHLIKCPHCGAEYHPAEIFEPKPFFGNPDLDRAEDGTLEYIGGEGMDLSSEYVCDYCGKRFKVRADVSFSAESSEFSEEHSTPVYEGCLGLFED